MSSREPAGRGSTTVALATVVVAVGVLLTMTPLRSVFTDWAWFTAAAGCCLPYVAIVAGLRLRFRPAWWHSLAGLLGSGLVLLWAFVPEHLALGVVPTPASIDDVRVLIDGARQSMSGDHAPLASTHDLRLVVAACLIALVMLADLLGVLLMRPLLAAAPLLEVLVVASATSGRSAGAWWFAAAAIGFLLIVLASTQLEDRAWGPKLDGPARRVTGVKRVAALAIVAALAVPLALPAASVNLLAKAAHHSSGSGSGNGAIELESFASLRGSLQQSTPADLFTVQVSPASAAPFYMRQVVLDEFTDDGWQRSDGPGRAVPLSRSSFMVGPDGASGPATMMEAQITIDRLGGDTLPILANPVDVRGAPARATWDSQTATISGARLQTGTNYTEVARQPEPTLAQLTAAPPWSGSAADEARYLALPAQPAQVHALADDLVAGIASPYEKARAISNYFTDGTHGFVYSLDAPDDDGRSALLTFLDQKHGFCQQFAAAAAVLMRLAGLASRVVIGYTHSAPGSDGAFVVSTADAHAWVEVYFTGIGWVPFDPTPLAGRDADRAVALPWAPHGDGATPQPQVSAQRPSASPTQPKPTPTEQAPVTAAMSQRTDSPWSGAGAAIGMGLAVAVVAAALAFGPAAARRRQRRSRLRRARLTGDSDLLWLELAATAVDRDALWPPNVTVAQVPGWLSERGMPPHHAATVTDLAERVQLDRFGPAPASDGLEGPAASLNRALQGWRRERRPGTLARSLVRRWLPASLVRSSRRWQR